MTAHACGECGMLHDTPTAQESEAVAIARIQAESALAIAKLQARAEVRTAEAEAEAAEDIAETQADAVVDAAVAEAELLGAAIEAGGEDAPDPIEIIAPETNVDEDADEDAPPPAEGSPVPETKHRSAGIGFW